MERRANAMSLSLGKKLRYASGNYGKSVMWNALELFLLFYLTDVLGIPPAIAGMIVFVSLAWDGITDPLVGYLVDRHVLKGGTYKPFLVAGPPFTALAFVTIFIDLPADMAAKISFVVAANLLFRTLYTFFDVPHNALLARVTADGRERTTLAGMRITFSSLGSVTAALGIAPVLMGATAVEESERFLIFAIATAALSALVLWQSMRIHDQVALQTVAEQQRRSLPVFQFLRTIFSNRDMVLLIVIGVWVSFTLPIFAKFLSYFAKYNLAQEDWVSPLVLVMMAGQVLGLPVWIKIAGRIAKARASQIAHLSVLGMTSLLLLTAVDAFWMLVPIVFVAGVGVGGVYMLSWAMSPDAVESLELSSGQRLEAGYFSFHTFTQKLSMGAGAGVAGYLLGLSDFDAATAVGPDSLVAIKAIMCVMPAAGAVGAIVALNAYRIDHGRHDQTVRALGRDQARS